MSIFQQCDPFPIRCFVALCLNTRIHPLLFCSSSGILMMCFGILHFRPLVENLHSREDLDYRVPYPPGTGRVRGTGTGLGTQKRTVLALPGTKVRWPLIFLPQNLAKMEFVRLGHTVRRILFC